jgi:hypothetical protein
MRPRPNVSIFFSEITPNVATNRPDNWSLTSPTSASLQILITRDSLIALIAMKPKTTSLDYPGYLDYLYRRERLVAAFYQNKHAGTPLEQLAHSYQPGIVLRLSLILQSSGFGCATTPGLYTYIQRNK